MVSGKVIQFRRGRHTIHERQFLIDLGLQKKSEAEKFVGKQVNWVSPAGKIIKGKISAPHGNRGILRAIFERGLPGQAITTKVNVLTNENKTDKSEKKHAEEK